MSAALLERPAETADLLRDLLEARDEAEAEMRRAEAMIRPLARQWANERRQFTLPTLDQLRRELRLNTISSNER